MMNPSKKGQPIQRPIYSITPFTLLDFPGKTACILWFAGCNMRCPFCYNPEIVFGKGIKTTSEALDFLRSRKGLLEGVVLSGGECTMHPGIVDLLTEIRRMGFAVKIDTNGSRPRTLQTLISRGLIDYVALDFKALEEKYRLVTGSDLFAEFEESLSLLLQSGLPFEVRTTVHSELLNKEDLNQMTQYLNQKGYKGTYYFQHYVNGLPTIAPLPHSTKIQGLETLATDKIAIGIRG